MADLVRALVQEGVLTPDGAARAARVAPDGDVLSAALELGLADEPALVASLARNRECPGIDLSRTVIPASALDVIAADFCREHRFVPIPLGRGELVLAMGDPDDLPAADEVRFVTGKNVLRYAAVCVAVLRAIDGLEAARRDRLPAWRGAHAPRDGDPERAHLAVVKPTAPGEGGLELPEATDSIELVSLQDLAIAFEPDLDAAPPPAAPPRKPPPAAAPAPQPPRGAPEAAPAAAGQGGEVTVELAGLAMGRVALVADDDPDVRKLVGAIVSKLGCVVLEAPDGRRALELVREARPDLVLLDAMMPGLHGFEVCRLVKGDRALRDTRVVLCSAIYRGTVGADAQVAFGADGFIEKPFRVEELVRVCKKALLGAAAAETIEERTTREQAVALWRSAADALSHERAAQAVDLARAAAEKDPWSAEAHYYLGHALSRIGQLYEAVAAYERSAELRPDVDASHQCLAQAYERLGFHKSAREAWTRAVDACQDPARKQAMQARLMHLLGAR